MSLFVYKLISRMIGREFVRHMNECNSCIDKGETEKAEIWLNRAKRWHEVSKALKFARYGVKD